MDTMPCGHTPAGAETQCDVLSLIMTDITSQFQGNDILNNCPMQHEDRVPEHGWELQSLVCMCGPGQLLPPCCGEGELQNRSLVWTPESHCDEHWDHGDHSDQPPFTEKEAFFV